MQIEDYFDFFGPDDIRIHGHRIGIEMILYEYKYRGRTAEQMRERFPTLSLEEIYATLLYYLQNREQLDAYLARWISLGEQMAEEQRRNPPPGVARLIALKEQMTSYRSRAE